MSTHEQKFLGSVSFWDGVTFQGDYGRIRWERDDSTDASALIQAAPQTASIGVRLWQVYDPGFGIAYSNMIINPDGAGVTINIADNGGFYVSDPGGLFGTAGGNVFFTGTMTGGSVPGARIPNGDVTNAKLAAAAANTLKANATAGSTNPADLAIAANTFPARSSSGNIAAKPITDFGLSLVDDANAAAARTTLGLATVAATGSASDLGAGTLPTARLGTGTASDGTLYVGNQTHASLIDYLRFNAYWFSDFMSGAAAVPELAYTTGNGGTSTAATPTGGMGTLGFVTDNVTAGSFGAALSAATVRFSLYRARVTWRVQLQMLKASSDDFAMRIGFIDTTNAKPVDGAYVEYDSSASANWRYCTANNSTRTENASATAVTASAWHLIAIEVNAAGTSVEFFLNGASLGTITTNIPTGATRLTNFGFHVVRLAGTPSQTYTATVDLVGVEIDFTAAR